MATLCRWLTARPSDNPLAEASPATLAATCVQDGRGTLVRRVRIRRCSPRRRHRPSQRPLGGSSTVSHDRIGRSTLSLPPG